MHLHLRSTVGLSTAALICALMAAPSAVAQVTGQNVNMVSGTNWTNGDPFLQRQNEPSIAVSTRNISHLLAGSNDYRTVDLPGLLGIEERGDAWLGLFKSFDGGRTWQSTLLPGYPLDASLQGLSSPIHGFQAASDPTVRAGTNGLFYYTGIAFNRGTNPGSAVFLARFIDLNNKENGNAGFESGGSMTNLQPRDTIKYIDTHLVGRGLPGLLFLDKPWVAVDIPRGGSTCTFSVNEDGQTITQTVPAGPVYMTYTGFILSGALESSVIVFQRSMDCGATWSFPRILSRNDELFGEAEHQGTVIAVDPSIPPGQPATLYVAWRRFGKLSDGDDAPAIFLAKSTDGGVHWGAPVPVVVFPKSCVQSPTGIGCPFDQTFTTASFRSNGYPAMTVDTNGRVYVAWSQRDANGDGKIMMGVSSHGMAFAPGSVAPVDIGAVTDDNGNAFTTLSNRGDQLMPSLNFTAGKLSLAYYDLRQDHTTGTFLPSPDPLCDPLITLPCLLGAQYNEIRTLEGELALPKPYNNPAVFSPYIVDSAPPLTVRRHTIDVMGAEAFPLPSYSLQVPSFNSFRISHYLFGTIPQLFNDVEQIQYNVPNLPLFVDGSAPFMGDYIDLAGTPQIVPDGRGGWTFNTSPAANPVFHATWTDNRDVVPPADGNWKNYTPPISASNLGSQPSKFDPTQSPLACLVGQTGMRNQNVYTAEISQGVILTSPQTSKPVLTPTGQPIQREFVVEVRNATNAARSFLLTIPTQPATATASFQQFSPQSSPVTSQQIQVNALSSQSLPVFVVANPGSTVAFPSVLVTATENDGSNPPLTVSLLLNSDPTNPALTGPDNALVGGTQIAINEFYNPGLANPGLASPGLANNRVANPGLANPGLANPGLANPTVVVALNPGLANPGLANPGLANPGLANPGLANQALTDASYTITNEGNTSAAYTVQFFQSGTLPAGAKFQVILSRLYFTPQAAPDCQLQQVATNVIIANITNPVFVKDPNQLGNPGVASLGIQTPTLNLAPGDSGQITIRSNLSLSAAEDFFVRHAALSPVVVSQAVNTVDVQNENRRPPINLIITSTSASLPVGIVAQPYNANLMAIGGNSGPRNWSLISGSSLPPGLQLNASTGAITGTLTLAGNFPFTVQVTDTGTPQHVATRQLTITVVTPVSVSTPSPTLVDGGVGSLYTQTFSAAGGLPPYTWSSTGTLPPGLTLGSNGMLSGLPTTPGTYSFTVKATDSAGMFASAPYTIFVTGAVLEGAHILFIIQPGQKKTGPNGLEALAQLFGANNAPIAGAELSASFGAKPCPDAALSGTLTAITDSSGLAVFTGISSNRGGEGYTAVATATFNPSVSATSNPFSIAGFCPTGSMTTLRRENSVTLLPNGKVLIAGGLNSNSVPLAVSLNTAELYDPVTGVFSATGNMTTPRDLATTTLLPDGKVLVAGGRNSNGNLASAELYDPTTGQFTPTGIMASPRQEHAATLLPNGKVLITGGASYNSGATLFASAELYDPGTGQFTPAGTMNSVRASHTATLLSNGKVLLASGLGSVAPNGSNQQLTTSAELYDPSTGVFTVTGSMTTARENHTATTLLSGKVLVSGGYSAPQPSVATPSAELYDPATGTFSPTGNMNIARAEQTSTLLPNGTVLIGGGFSAGGFFSGVELSTAEIYNPSTGSFKGPASMTFAHSRVVAPLLPNGAVLLASGTTAELFFPTEPPFLVEGFSAIGGNLPVQQETATATQLPNGLVLFTGGFGTSGTLNTAVLFDPAGNGGTGSFTPTGSMSTARAFHTATLLPSGKVLVAGGQDSAGISLASAELYDPAGGSFTLTGPMGAARTYHTATLLSNGLVLIAGGRAGTTDLATAEIFDPTAGINGGFGLTGSMAFARSTHTATLLPNGNVLLAGGFGAGGAQATAEFFDPYFPGGTGFNGRFLNLETQMVHPRWFHSATYLGDSRVLFTGGQDASGPLAFAEIFDPSLPNGGRFVSTSNLPTAGEFQATVLLPNGKVLIAGGIDATNNPVASAQLFDPKANSGTGGFQATASMTSPRSAASALLAKGKVLIAGGAGPSSFLQTAEAYTSGNIRELQPQSCSYEGHITSVGQFSTPAAIRFVNNSVDQTFQVFWLDYNGQRKFYATLGPGQSYVQQTFLTHPWVIADTSTAPNLLGQCQEIYLPIQEQAPAVFPPPSF